jgi:hypothetical protein
MENVTTIEYLLQETQRIAHRQQEMAVLRGENFNLFSILKMERKENSTHSAFLEELLNPKGSHLLGDVFLRSFLQEIDFKNISDFDFESAKTKVEYHIAFKDIENKTGGRIDILISDKNGNTISVENKIDAGDQDYQIERYANFNKEKNTVYYLTLTGHPPSKKSKGDLNEDEDYHCISYSDTIISWLEKCHKEASNQAILRETIKQYMILISKLTNKLSSQEMKKELEQLISKNYSSAKLIQKAVFDAELQKTKDFVVEFSKSLKDQLNETQWIIEVQDGLHKPYHGIKILNKNWNSNVFIKIEAEKKILQHGSYFGIVAMKNLINRDELNTKLSSVLNLTEWNTSNAWPCYKNLFNLGDSQVKEDLFEDYKFLELINTYSNIVTEFAKSIETVLESK